MFRFTAELWPYQGEAAWWFVTVPVDVGDTLRELTEGQRRGFGSVPVRVTVGASTWSTSVFPDKTSGSYVLPVKKAVRVREDLEDGDPVDVALEVDER